MKEIYVVAHTHWDFEWYFSRYEARVQFMYHMDEVFEALENNQLTYYALDGQMSIIDDYLETCPNKKEQLEKFVKSKRLFIGPWYTQIDEMVTSGEAIVHNLQQGIRKAEDLGNVMRVGYLPDSFGQSQDMPKIYQGFDILYSIFWRGMPKELSERYFNWKSEDGSIVLVANLKNGYYVGAEWMMGREIFEKLTSNNSCVELNLLPVGGDQRAIDLNLKEKIRIANDCEDRVYYHEANYLQFFHDLDNHKEQLPTYTGEFIDPSDSKIHRGIYSSRADLKQLYDSLERQMVYEVQPLMVIAKKYGIQPKQGACNFIWETIARGQAHDSSGGCNSDKTNQAIYQRGIDAKQMSQSLVDYLTRKLGEAGNYDLIIWNLETTQVKKVHEVKVSTINKDFKILDENDQEVAFEIISQYQENAAPLRRNLAERLNQEYYITTISILVDIKALDYNGFTIVEEKASLEIVPIESESISNQYFKIIMKNGKIQIIDLKQDKVYDNVLQFEDGGDEGDNYDYSPPFNDLIINLDFKDATVLCHKSTLISEMVLTGEWQIPSDLAEREKKQTKAKLPYRIVLQLKTEDVKIYWYIRIDNRYVCDHRVRLLMKTDVKAQSSYADTPFGIIERPMDDWHLADWQEIGYREEPTSIRPMIHYANLHDSYNSWSILVNGTKAYQMIDEHTLALTLYRGVGYLGRPDLKRRPGDASGLEAKYVETPDSQLNKELRFTGAIIIQQKYDASLLQREHHHMQPTIYYQKQTINRFTTPLQLFQSLPIKESLVHKSLIQVVTDKLVVSNLELTSDQTGYTIRLYNPNKEQIVNSGQLIFNQNVSVQLVNLNDESIELIADHITVYELPAFKSGEIKTYAIYPE